MRSRFSLRKLLGVVLVSFAAANFVQCDMVSDHHEGNPGELPAVVYGGDASDEALEHIWPRTGEAEPSAENAVALTSPAEGAVVAADQPLSLNWTTALGDATPIPTSPSSPVRRDDLHLRISFGWPVAHAHLPPVTGWVYLVELQGESGEPFRIFTTETSWTANDQARQEILARGRSFEVRIFNAYLNQNVLEEGPFVSPGASRFTVAAP